MNKVFCAIIVTVLLSFNGNLAAEANKDLTKLKVGDVFEISIKDQSASTGYSTVLKSMPDSVVLISAEVLGDKSKQTLVGEGKNKVFVFLAVKPFKGKLEINQARIWEKPLVWLYNENNNKFIYDLVIHP